MREIKFRAYKKNNKGNKWMNVIDVWTDGKGEVHHLYGEVLVGENQTWFDGFELMQYTGLKDKNGKEIYEGDILTAIERNQGQKEGYIRKELVYSYPGGFKVFGRPMVEFTTQDDNKTIKYCMWRTSSSSNDFIYLELVDFEVIGNIYEDADLEGE